MRYITEETAYGHYAELYALHTLDIDVKDKSNRLRTRFEAITKDAVTTKYGGSVPGHLEKATHHELLMDLFGSDQDHRLQKLKTKVFTVKGRFNKLQHDKDADIHEEQYRKCLRSVLEYVSFLSSAPIPPHLLDASSDIDKFSMNRRLSIVIVLELFDTLRHAEQGMLIFKNLKKLMKTRDRFQLDKLDLNVVVYTNPVECYAGDAKDYGNSCADEAWTKGSAILDKAVNEWKADKNDGTDVPWFIWICHDPYQRLSSEHISRMNTLLADKEVRFYPIKIKHHGEEEWDEGAMKHFLDLWPLCSPYPMSSRGSDNFFNKSILLTIQRMQKKVSAQNTSGMFWKISSSCIPGHNKKVGQDYIFLRPDGDYVFVVGADGAGYARYANEGAKFVSKEMRDLLTMHKADIFSYSDHEIKENLLDVLRQKIEQKAIENNARMDDYMSTLMFFVSDGRQYIAANLGDGMIGCMDSDGNGTVISSPEKGKYVNQSYFVTQPDSYEHLRIERGTYDPEKVYFLMTDGSAECLYDNRNRSFARIMSVFCDWIRKYEPHPVSDNLKTAMMKLFPQVTSDDCALALIYGTKK